MSRKGGEKTGEEMVGGRGGRGRMEGWMAWWVFFLNKCVEGKCFFCNSFCVYVMCAVFVPTQSRGHIHKHQKLPRSPGVWEAVKKKVVSKLLFFCSSFSLHV